MGKTCASFVRLLMIIFNTLFILIGLPIIGLGIYLCISGYATQANGTLSILAYPCIGFIVLGVVVVLLAICGCCGALRYNRFCLGLYFTFLLFVFAVEIATGIAGVLYKQEVRVSVLNFLEVAVEAYVDDGTKKLTTLDLIQGSFNCCGFEGPNDYIKKHLAVPRSCCAFQECSKLDGASLLSIQGCKYVADDIEHRTLIIGLVIISLALVQLLGLIFSIVLCCSARNRQSRRPYYQPVQT